MKHQTVQKKAKRAKRSLRSIKFTTRLTAREKSILVRKAREEKMTPSSVVRYLINLMG